MNAYSSQPPSSDLFFDDDVSRVTSVPPFDLGTFARESDSKLEAVAAEASRETSPPPALHPASIPPKANPPPIPERMPAAVQAQIADFARRAELLTTTLRIGALAREEAGRILETELDALEDVARVGHVDSLRALAKSLRGTIAELGFAPAEEARICNDILVLDTNPDSSALVSLAMEAQGSSAVIVTSLAQLGRLRGSSPDALFVAIDFPGADPNTPFGTMLREVVGAEVPVVVYGRASEVRLASIAERAGADATLRIDMGIDDVLHAVQSVFERLEWDTAWKPRVSQEVATSASKSA